MVKFIVKSYMLGLLKARECTAQDWSALLKRADERFHLNNFIDHHSLPWQLLR
jgi:hypothetical protein